MTVEFDSVNKNITNQSNYTYCLCYKVSTDLLSFEDIVIHMTDLDMKGKNTELDFEDC